MTDTTIRTQTDRADALLAELAEAQQRVQALCSQIAAAPAPACPTTGAPRAFPTPLTSDREALEAANTLIGVLVDALRPFALIREMRVIDADGRDPKTVCDLTVPIGLCKRVDQALNLYASYLHRDSHRRHRRRRAAAAEAATRAGERTQMRLAA